MNFIINTINALILLRYNKHLTNLMKEVEREACTVILHTNFRFLEIHADSQNRPL